MLKYLKFWSKVSYLVQIYFMEICCIMLQNFLCKLLCKKCCILEEFEDP